MHLSFVSMEIIGACAVEDVGDPDLAVQCALLHDTLEDTRVHYEQLHAEFGGAVAEGVLALTVNKKLPRSEQMTECLPRILQQPAEIWMVKLADRISNLQPPPRHWSKDRIRDYHREAQVIHDALQDAERVPGRAAAHEDQRVRRIRGLGAFKAARETHKGEGTMGDKGKRDKGGREKRKKPKLDPKERRKLKRDKDQQRIIPSTIPLTPPPA